MLIRRLLFMIMVLVVTACQAGAADLPVTDVTLYTSGVGFFRHVGRVDGNADVNLSFKPEQINDLLKSMVVMDFDGGIIGGVSYGAKDPVSKTLQAFKINIADNPSMAALLNRLRGAEVRVEAVGPVSGRIMGVQTRRKVVDKEVVETEVLTLLTAEGMKSVTMEEVSSIRILDEGLNRELHEALSVLASGLDNLRRPVTIKFNGNGNRRVSLGYLAETPVWKTAYRLVAGEKEALLQGWAVVENTSDYDWKNVRLALVSGSPISFIQDLYSPLYSRRPVVPYRLLNTLAPVSYAGSLENNLIEEAKISERSSSIRMRAAAAPMPAPMAAKPAGRLTGGDAFFALDDMRDGLQASVQAAARAEDLGRAFEYAIREPVNLSRQQSAMIPIVSGSIPALPVSIYNAGVQALHPLYGLKLKNNTGVHLTGGPLTVYSSHAYSGDALLEDLAPGEERLVSFAVDLGVTCERKASSQARQMVSLRIVKGTLSIKRKLRQETEYTIKVKDGKKRDIIVEHPFLAGWDLATPLKADERTAGLYRFALPVDGGKPAILKVAEEKIMMESLGIIDSDSDLLVGYMQTGPISPGVRSSLQRLLDMKKAISDIEEEKGQAEQEIAAITTEQARIRSNMSALDRNSDLYKRYVSKFDEQETRVEKLRAYIKTLQAKELAARSSLNSYAMELNVE